MKPELSPFAAHLKYNLHEFEPGDSKIFLEPNSKVSAAITMWCKRRANGWRFKTRKAIFRNINSTQVTRII